jgi:hypothetical protein
MPQRVLERVQLGERGIGFCNQVPVLPAAALLVGPFCRVDENESGLGPRPARVEDDFVEGQFRLVGERRSA